MFGMGDLEVAWGQKEIFGICQKFYVVVVKKPQIYPHKKTPNQYNTRATKQNNNTPPQKILKTQTKKPHKETKKPQNQTNKTPRYTWTFSEWQLL